MTLPDKSSASSLNSFDLDDLDRQIVQLLHRDGRMAYTEIAKRLGSAEATIRYRVQRLIESGAITIQAYLNPEKLGYRHIALVTLNCTDLHRAEAIAADLAAMDAVSYVAFTAGSYDLFVEVTFEDHSGLLAFLQHLRSLPGVVSSQSQIVLKLLKSQYSFHLKT
ncbi:Lrp/AsnC family transcriptional regulator [Geitlerinema sp. PCC 7407]|uniref:Lrp/AsnC family transcriptional regulator n=1 Tax=Geitlerinema sp. PCC 7407 TaxID=1173025 RepID=UPI00029F89CA|nr:AsnC family transcriptional regulator [Geitlerinema sp. PCC 7407]AFY66211.1 transcriptional regulator, AsnC family [Geitlerinema sp. PCC 7407]